MLWTHVTLQFRREQVTSWQCLLTTMHFFMEIMSTFKAIKRYFGRSYDKQNITLLFIFIWKLSNMKKACLINCIWIEYKCSILYNLFPYAQIKRYMSLHIRVWPISWFCLPLSQIPFLPIMLLIHTMDMPMSSILAQLSCQLSVSNTQPIYPYTLNLNFPKCTMLQWNIY